MSITDLSNNVFAVAWESGIDFYYASKRGAYRIEQVPFLVKTEDGIDSFFAWLKKLF